MERGVGYVKSNALRGRTFDSLQAQNDHLQRWEKNVADTRIHGTTKRHVGTLFETVERAALGPLPQELFPFFEEGKRKVSRDGHIEVKRSFYSAPPEYVGREVWVRWNSQVVRILNHRLEQIAMHCRQEVGKFSTLPEHIARRRSTRWNVEPRIYWEKCGMWAPIPRVGPRPLCRNMVSEECGSSKDC